MMHRTHPLLAPFALFLIITLGYCPAASRASELAQQLPDLGNTNALSPAEQRSLGRDFMHWVAENHLLLEDPLVETYLQDLADKLQSQLSGHNQKISIFVVDHPDINAFAGPGGNIGINSGLILSTRSEDELASVIAHEIAHITQHHLVRQMENARQYGLQNLGAIMAAIILGQDNAQAQEAILTGTAAASIQQQLTYSRTFEQEADRIGLQILSSASYDPRAMADFFTLLQAQQSMLGDSVPEFMRTHPITHSRIADVQARAEEFPPSSVSSKLLFELNKARVAAQAERKESARNKFLQGLAKRDSNDPVGRYFLALSALHDGEYDQARQQLRPLLNSRPQRIHYYYAAAEVELADHRPGQAREFLTEILRLYPGNPVLTELQAKTLLQMNENRAAFQLLKEQLRNRDPHPRLYRLYAQAAKEAGEDAEAYRALAELEYFQGNIHQAVDFISRAIDVTKSDFERLKLNARLEAIKNEAISD